MKTEETEAARMIRRRLKKHIIDRFHKAYRHELKMDEVIPRPEGARVEAISPLFVKNSAKYVVRHNLPAFLLENTVRVNGVEMYRLRDPQTNVTLDVDYATFSLLFKKQPVFDDAT